MATINGGHYQHTLKDVRAGTPDGYFPPAAKVNETGVAVAVEKCSITGSWKVTTPRRVGFYQSNGATARLRPNVKASATCNIGVRSTSDAPVATSSPNRA